MIVNTQQNNIQLIGSIKEFKTSIDPRNIDIITTLLSSNLYSNPEESFLREIVSNAWDSHVEAGTTDTPILVKFSNFQYTRGDICVRDYGTGLSPERFETIYCNIGSSTKRESNDYIGCFGLGRFSCMACSNMAYITSYYNGIKYDYVMTKDGNSITINHVNTSNTDERNGLSVTLKNVYLYNYKKGLKHLIYFPNIYVEGLDNDDFNAVKVKKFKYFAASTIGWKGYYLLLGNVLYSCDWSKIDMRYPYNCNKHGIVFKFDIGELEVTPNRESVIYTEKTINTIKKRVKEAELEVLGNIKKLLKPNYDDILEYSNIVAGNIVYEPCNNSILKSVVYTQGSYYTVNLIKAASWWATYTPDKAEDYVNNALIPTFKDIRFDEEENKIIKRIRDTELPGYKGNIYDGTFYKIKGDFDRAKYLHYKKILCLKNVSTIGAKLKAWLKLNYNDYTVIDYFTKEAFIDYLLNKHPYLKKLNFKGLILESFYEAVMNNAIVLDVETDKKWLEYKKENKKEGSTVKEIVINTLSTPHKWLRFTDLNTCIDSLKKEKCGIVLTTTFLDVRVLSTIEHFKFKVYKVNKKLEKALLHSNIKQIMTLEEFYKLPRVVRTATVLKYLKYPAEMTGTSPGFFYEVSRLIPSYWQKELEVVYKDVRYIHRSPGNLSLTLEENCKEDPYIRFLCEKLKDYLEKYKYVEHKYNLNIRSLLALAVMKSKTFRIDYAYYKEMKKIPFIKLLCKN